MTDERPSKRRIESPLSSPVRDGSWEFELASGRLLAVNDVYCAQSGFERADLLGMSIADLDRSRPARETTGRYRDLAVEGPTRWRTSHLRKDGGTLVVDVTALVPPGDDAAVGRAYLHEVTASEHAAREGPDLAQLFDTLFRSSPVCATVTRLADDRFLEVNDAFLRTFGYERDEVVGSDAITLGLWVDLAERQRFLEATRRDGRVSDFEAEFRTKNGAVLNMLAVAELVEVGGELCALTHTLDITARRRAEAQAAERESRLLSAIDNAPFGAHMYRLDPDGRLVFTGYNLQAERSLGFSHSPLLGLTLEEAFPGNAGTETAAAYRRVARDGGTWDTDEYAYDAGGICGVFEVHAFATGEMRMAVFFRDITEKRRLETAMQEGERRLALALKSANLGTWDVDVATLTLELDDAACGLLGIDPDRFGRTTEELYEVVHPEDREMLRDTTTRAREHGGAYSVRFRVIWPDGSVHWMAVHLDSVRDAEGEVVRWQGVGEDVTEQEVARERLAASVRALRALSWCNQTLVRAEDEQALLTDVCEVGVEQGGYRMVWVGYAEDDEAKSVRPMAHAGHVDGFFDSVHYRWSDTDTDHSGLAGRAIRLKEPVIVRTMENDARYALFAKEALSRGYASAAAFPLLDAEREVFGAITFVSGRHEAFDTDEMALLNEFALDLAFGIDALRTRMLRDTFEADLVVANERLRSTMRTLRALSWCNQTLVRATDERTLLDDVCKVGVEQGGYRMVWVGYARDDEMKSVHAMAHAGHEDGFLEAVGFNWGEQDTDLNGPPGLAIRSAEPIIMRSMADDPRYRAFAGEALSRGYASVAALPLLDFEKHPFGAVMFISGSPTAFDDDEMALLQELAMDLAFGIEALRTKDLRVRFEEELVASNDRLQGLLRQIVESMSRVVEARDPYTQGHQERVALIAKAIAVEMGLDEEEIDGIEVAGLVHDVGKLAVPSEILTTPTQLTDTEFRLIKEHPAAGFEILKGIDFFWPVAQMALQHHERQDGSGYPQGLKGEQTLLGARILAVADVVEAMASHRPYRPALGLEAAIDEIRKSPDKFDPQVSAACVRLWEQGRLILDA